MELDVGWESLSRDTAGPGRVRGPGCSAEPPAPNFIPGKTAESGTVHDATAARVWEVTVTLKSPQSHSQPQAGLGADQSCHRGRVKGKCPRSISSPFQECSSGRQGVNLGIWTPSVKAMGS